MKIQEKIEKWIPHDKALHHIEGECIMSIVILLTFWRIGLYSIPLGLFTNFVVQWGKEYFIDRKKVTGFSWADIGFGMSGCIPVGIMTLIVALIV